MWLSADTFQCYHHHHHQHTSVMVLGQVLTRSGLSSYFSVGKVHDLWGLRFALSIPLQLRRNQVKLVNII